MKLNNFCFLSVRFRNHTFSVCNLNSTQMCVIFHCVYSKCCLCVCFYGLLLPLRILTINKTYTHTQTQTQTLNQPKYCPKKRKIKSNYTRNIIHSLFLMSSFLPCHDILPGFSVVVSQTLTHTLNTHATPHSEPCYCVYHLIFIKSSCT